LIAMTGLITGLAAALSMAASEYLSTKSESGGKNPVRAALYTGSAYVVTVALLILPYLTLDRGPIVSLFLTLCAAIAIVAGFTFYNSVVRDEPFCKRFLEMAGLSLGVAAVSFIVGFVVRHLLGVDL
jgi:VIT1/CCC1 family predicted Fe2+/Mn2+ transporter